MWVLGRIGRRLRAGVAVMAAGVFLAGAAGPAAAMSLLYDADFADDPIGQAPAVDAGAFPRTGPSLLRSAFDEAIGIGLPEVAAQFQGLDAKPLVFQATPVVDPYIPTEKAVFGLGLGESSYVIDFDVAVGSLAPGFSDSFTLLLDGDAGLLRNLYFRANGEIRMFQNAAPVAERSHVLGTYAFGEAMHFRVVADFGAQRLMVRRDGVLVLDVPLYGSDVEQARFTIQDADGDGSATAAIDNVRIALPEPGAALLLPGAGAWLFLARRRDRRTIGTGVAGPAQPIAL